MTSIRDSDLQKRVRALVEEDMRNRLAKKPELQAKSELLYFVHPLCDSISCAALSHT